MWTGAALALLPSVAVVLRMEDAQLQLAIAGRAAVGVAGFLVTYWLIPVVSQYTLRKGLSGKDLGKRYTASKDTAIPEALGIVSAVGFLVCIIFSQLLFAETLAEQVDYNSALISVCFMVLLGFMDDVLDLPWRAKLILPTVASFPLLCSYTGSTSILVPLPLRPLLFSGGDSHYQNGNLTALGKALDALVVVDLEAKGAILELGWLYLLYMGILAVFCTNAINIYAGINGLEAGQAYIIGCGVLFYTAQQLHLNSADDTSYLFSMTMILPFLGCTLGLLAFNWFPSRVFVGDTFCYFAGMTFAVVGIHGHLSKPLWLFFLPQLINFLYSLPQLFKLVPCPRHRLPQVDEKTGLMVPSTFPCKKHEHRLLKRLHFLPADAEFLPNFTVINLTLRVVGSMGERQLCSTLLVLQAASCLVVLAVRYSALAAYIFDG